MENHKPSKAIKRKVRDLAGLAYERELSKCLTELLGNFKKWQEKEIDSFELTDLIHQFHQGLARDLFSFYNGPNKELLVARGLNEGLLEPAEIPEELKSHLEPTINWFRELSKG